MCCGHDTIINNMLLLNGTVILLNILNTCTSIYHELHSMYTYMYLTVCCSNVHVAMYIVLSSKYITNWLPNYGLFMCNHY